MEKRKLLSAVLLALPLAAAQSARAVSLSSDGTGEVLIFPYYTVRNGFETYLSINNLTTDTKAVRLRFIEALNGAEVMDFNLYMSPLDTWTGAVVENGSGARVVTFDGSCTTPTFINSNIANFVNFHYNGNVADVRGDAGPRGLDRTREGMIEVFDMGVVPTAATGGIGVNIVQAVRTHQTGVAANCQALQSSALDLSEHLRPPSGGLAGAGYLVNSNAGLEFGYDAVALVDFARANPTGIWHAPGSPGPSFDDANPRESRLFTASHVGEGRTSPAQLYMDTWASGTDAVSALLMTESVTNEYVLEATTASLTDWIVTFPTKRKFVNGAGGVTAASAIAPFQRPFTSAFLGMSGLPGTACDEYDEDIFDRAGRKAPKPPSPIFGTIPPGYHRKGVLCGQVNVQTFFPSNPQQAQIVRLLGSATSASWSFPPAGFTSGYTTLRFTSPTEDVPIVTRALVGSANVYRGLPAVGFMLQTFTRHGLVINGVPSTSGYGGNFTHKYLRRIEPRTP